jgi:hypothetical protein
LNCSQVLDHERSDSRRFSTCANEKHIGKVAKSYHHATLR